MSVYLYMSDLPAIRISNAEMAYHSHYRSFININGVYVKDTSAPFFHTNKQKMQIVGSERVLYQDIGKYTVIQLVHCQPKNQLLSQYQTRQIQNYHSTLLGSGVQI